jgi:hypothetical protein
MKKETIKKGQELLGKISDIEYERSEKLRELSYAVTHINNSFNEFKVAHLKNNSQPILDIKKKLNDAHKIFISSMEKAIKDEYENQIRIIDIEIEGLK